MATPYCDFTHFQYSFSAGGACQKFKKWRGACAESVLKICVSAIFLQKARAETRHDGAGQKYTFTQKTNRKLKLKRTHSWFLHWQKRLVLSVVSSSRNRTFTNRSVLMPRFYTCETANPAISHVPYTWHAVRCILNAHCVPQRVFCSKSTYQATVWKLRNDKANSFLLFQNRTKNNEKLPLFGGPYRNSHRQFFHSPVTVGGELFFLTRARAREGFGDIFWMVMFSGGGRVAAGHRQISKKLASANSEKLSIPLEAGGRPVLRNICKIENYVDTAENESKQV